jgi:hypothetical protein
MDTEGGECYFLRVKEVKQRPLFRHLGCEHAIQAVKNSNLFNNSRVPLKWSQIVEETISGRQSNALEGVIAVREIRD